MDMYERTREMLRARDQTIPEIAEAAGVGESWLYKINRGAIPNPYFRNLELVHDYLLRRQKRAA